MKKKKNFEELAKSSNRRKRGLRVQRELHAELQRNLNKFEKKLK